MNAADSPATVRCTRCRRDVVPLAIAYGYPGPELLEAAERGEVRLGGCVIDVESPDFCCPGCHAPFPFAADAASGRPLIPDWWPR